MKQTINVSDFRDAFHNIERGEQFSYEGLNALYAYFEEYEDSTGDTIELDPIAFCCEFTEYKDLKEFQDDYGEEYKTIEDVENKTTVIPFDDAFIIVNF